MNCEKIFQIQQTELFKKIKINSLKCAQSYSLVGIWCKETGETAGGDELPKK